MDSYDPEAFEVLKVGDKKLNSAMLLLTHVALLHFLGLSAHSSISEVDVRKSDIGLKMLLLRR